MRWLRDLVKENPDVWICCEDERTQGLFLIQAELEGFRALDGHWPTQLENHRLYGITDDMTVGYLSAMCWSLTRRPGDRHVRVDFGKYLAGEDYRIA